MNVVNPGSPSALGGYSGSRYGVEEVSKVDSTTVNETNTTKERGYNEEDLKKAVGKLNDFLKTDNTEAIIEKHEYFGDTMITIVNSDTKEVILEIPPKKILDMVAKCVNY